ncbi:scavenger receptor cysteine-rich type 1 protein M130-like, partial [Centropristis striata]|uniref:scavenger receptor cysteine-rich type 1 protein M130-like n=1 Tax=Centropristis striata TaxID=184440 RepID=UPI0027E1BA2A
MVQLDMDHLLVLSLLLWSSDYFRLVRGGRPCAGTLEVKHEGQWSPVADAFSYWRIETAAFVCSELNCGSAVSVGLREESSAVTAWMIGSDCAKFGPALRECLTSTYSSYVLHLTCSESEVETEEFSDEHVWMLTNDCVQSGSGLRECVYSSYSSSIVNLTCSDSVRLVNGTSLCSGRLEVKSDQSNQSWSSVCEADFDQQDAEVVCRELGCGDPSVLQGALYGEVETTMWTKEFQCGGNESALLDCRSSGSDRNTCSPGRAVGLTCSEPVRLVGGDSRCTGTLEVKQGEWRPVNGTDWTLKEADAVCRKLGCGSAVSVARREESSERSAWSIRSDCFHAGSALRECVTSSLSSSYFLDLTCSDSVRLVNGTSLCSGRLEVKSDQSN